MITGMLGAALIALSTPVQAVDTTLSVRQGARLSVDANYGSVQIETWGRDAVRVVAEHAVGHRRRGDDMVEIRASSSHVSIDTNRAHGHEPVRYRITVPAWMAVNVDAHASTVSVQGVRGEVSASTIRGSIAVSGASEFVAAVSVEGQIQVEGARGRVQAETVNQGVVLRNIRGEVQAETVNGGIRLEDVHGSSIQAETVNGGISYSGAFQEGGYYRFISHNGAVTVAVPQLPDARVSVSTFNGGFDSEFPLQLTSMSGGKSFSFVLGEGTARLELESFNGQIRLVRGGGSGSGRDD